MTAEPGATIVSGGSSGIGRAVVEGLADRGRPVAILDIHRPPEDLLGSDQVMFLECDAADPTAVHEAVTHVGRRFGRIDGLATCAGIGGAAARQAIGSSQWDRVRAIVNVNLLGSYWLLESCAVAMAEGRAGARSCWSVPCCRARAWPECPRTAHPRVGIEGLTRSAAVELADRGIRVNCVLPGPILTPMSRTGFEADGLSVEEWIERMAGSVPLHRVGAPRDVAAVVLFLLDETSGYMTGASLMVDGGANVG